MDTANLPPESRDWLLRLAERCRAARKAANLTYREAAESAGVSLSTIQRTESGTVDTGADVLRKLADTYGLTLCELVEGKPGRPKGKGKKS